MFHNAAVAPAKSPLASLTGGGPRVAQVIGDYRLVREIGRGGMGVVYEAVQISLGRRVALKILPFTSGHEDKHISRFKNEAQAAAQVQHPNIVPVYAVGEQDGVHFYAMQLVEGQSLTALLDETRTCEGTESGGTTAPNHLRTTGKAMPPAKGAEQAKTGSSTNVRQHGTISGATKRAIMCEPSRGWELRRPRLCTRRMNTASSTATSSRRTCSSTIRASCG